MDDEEFGGGGGGWDWDGIFLVNDDDDVGGGWRPEFILKGSCIPTFKIGNNGWAWCDDCPIDGNADEGGGGGGAIFDDVGGWIPIVDTLETIPPLPDELFGNEDGCV